MSHKKKGVFIMVKEVITTGRPPTGLPFSPGIKTEHFIFVSGTVGNKNPDTGEEVKGIEAQTRQSLDIIEEILEAAGSSLSDVVSATVYLPDIDNFLKMNEVYKEYFPKDPPARATISAGLVSPSMLVEIQCIAVRSSGQQI